MWALIKKILEWLLSFVTNRAEKETAQEEVKQQLDRELEEIDEEHKKEVEEVPSDGDALVDYWRTRGMRNGVDD